MRRIIRVLRGAFKIESKTVVLSMISGGGATQDSKTGNKHLTAQSCTGVDENRGITTFSKVIKLVTETANVFVRNLPVLSFIVRPTRI